MECKLDIHKYNGRIILDSVPIFEDSFKHGRNWGAKIDREGPGKELVRCFFSYSKERGYYEFEDGAVKVGDAIEFGADYVSCSGIRYGRRWHGVVITISENYITIEQAKTAIQAIKKAPNSQENQKIVIAV